MSIWDEPLTTEEYVKRLFESKTEQRRKDAALPFEENVEIVLDLRDASLALRAATAVELPVPSVRPA
jgi:hypothetical protein